MDYSQFVFLILCLICVWLLMGVMTNNNLINAITGNPTVRGEGFKETSGFRGGGFSQNGGGMA